MDSIILKRSRWEFHLGTCTFCYGREDHSVVCPVQMKMPGGVEVMANKRGGSCLRWMKCGKRGFRRLCGCEKPVFENQTDFAIKTQSVGEGNYKERRRAKHNETKKNKSDKTICSFVSSVNIFNSPGSLAFKDRSRLRTESLIATHYWLQASVYHRKGRDVFGAATNESPMSPNILTALNTHESTILTSHFPVISVVIIK